MGLTSGAQEATSRGRHEKVVVFKNCFTVDEMNSAPELILTVRDGLRNVCAPFGITKKINVFDGHPMGVCSVAFVKHEEADRAIQNLHARMFRGRVPNLTLITGGVPNKNQETLFEKCSYWELLFLNGASAKIFFSNIIYHYK